jgi:transcriptional regulator with XRE-family HTH domain
MLNLRLLKLRQERGLSARALASQISCSYSAYQLYEKGLRSPPLDVLQQISKQFDVSLRWLIEGVGEPHSPDRSVLIERAIVQLEQYSRQTGAYFDADLMTRLVNFLIGLKVDYDVEPSFDLLQKVSALQFPNRRQAVAFH